MNRKLFKGCEDLCVGNRTAKSFSYTRASGLQHCPVPENSFYMNTSIHMLDL